MMQLLQFDWRSFVVASVAVEDFTLATFPDAGHFVRKTPPISSRGQCPPGSNDSVQTDCEPRPDA